MFVYTAGVGCFYYCVLFNLFSDYGLWLLNNFVFDFCLLVRLNGFIIVLICFCFFVCYGFGCYFFVYLGFMVWILIVCVVYVYLLALLDCLFVVIGLVDLFIVITLRLRVCCLIIAGVELVKCGLLVFWYLVV